MNRLWVIDVVINLFLLEKEGKREVKKRKWKLLIE
mgnify:CR=1 FL=1